MRSSLRVSAADFPSSSTVPSLEPQAQISTAQLLGGRGKVVGAGAAAPKTVEKVQRKLGFFAYLWYNRIRGEEDAGARKKERGVFEIVDTESLVPPKHLLRKIDAAVDFTRIYDMVEPLYCLDNGRPSIDPVVLFKMVLIQHLYGLPSLRRTAEEVSANMCYRWFLGYRLQEETPHFSTISYNFRHRFTTETVDQIFAWILSEIAEAGIPCLRVWCLWMERI